ncbi:MAG: type I-U CRISPR-associated helicase/endonuclease Cas3 [Phycisphaeraceae bacterium]|nr:type I-U CRISPR-associated helicase/endonuclease Cas3 [Phycisphaeraceae bacterium]
MPQDSNLLDSTFKALTGHAPFPWQRKMFNRFLQGDVPMSVSLPTGLGKTSIMAIWLIARAQAPGKLPRRLIYVINRRTVVDQATREAENLRRNLVKTPALFEALAKQCALPLETSDAPLAISTLRGQFADNGQWCADPARPAIIVGTVDMIGSRLLFSGYGVGFKRKPLHAGLLGQDALLIHDEAHLEPAFQSLLTSIQREQARCREFQKFHVMELSATCRSDSSVSEQKAPFRLTDADRAEPAVKERINAEKTLHLHPLTDEKKQLVDKLAGLALQHKDSARAILVFARLVEDVNKIVEKLAKAKQKVLPLTGTLRGLERDGLVRGPVFIRFLPECDRPKDVQPAEGTVYLVCTSAGEVGVNISADHLVCDLSTFESMAQRFGRVNRFGKRDDTRIDIAHPMSFDESKEPDGLEARRRKTLELLDDLVKRHNGDASPAALDQLPDPLKRDAFSPTPTILPVTDILFDAWTMTTIREKLPGRPPVEPYLHGIRDWEPPQTQVAWREEVGVITDDLLGQYKPEDLLEDYPLKAHELLRDHSDRVFKELTTIALRHPHEPAWLLDDDGTVKVYTLEELTGDPKKGLIERRTVLLSPAVGGIEGGLLKGKSLVADDVADQWMITLRRQGQDVSLPGRVRVWDNGDNDPSLEEKIAGMRLVRRIVLGDRDDGNVPVRRWLWYARPRIADDDLSRTAVEPIAWDHHTRDVTDNIARIVVALRLPEDFQQALTLAAGGHDLGKKRKLWQRSIGNPDPDEPFAKSGRDPVTGRRWVSQDICPDYRHEFGSLLDVMNDQSFKDLSEKLDLQDLILHLIAAHHGHARPHFPVAFDPEKSEAQAQAVASEVPRRFARLQRKYGRWGLAYLESLLRAADYAASAQPSAVKELLEEAVS